MIQWQERPIDNWPGELTARRKAAPFDAGWGRTLTLLNRELKMLDARAVVVLVALASKDFRLDGKPRAGAKAEHPGVILTFTCRYGPLRYACDTFTTFDDNVRAIALGLEALRKVERYGITRRGEQYTGWSALPPGTAMGARMTATEAARVLHDLASPDSMEVGPDALVGNRELIELAYKTAAKNHHPDHGGSADLMSRATEARDVLLAESD